MLLVDMTPEAIRDVFKNHGEDLDRLEHAILVALDKLEWIEKRDAKAKSPYSLSKLTAGLSEEERGRVIDHAIRLSNKIQRPRLAEVAAAEAERIENQQLNSRILNMEVGTKAKVDRLEEQLEEMRRQVRRLEQELMEARMGFVGRILNSFLRR